VQKRKSLAADQAATKRDGWDALRAVTDNEQ